MNESFRLRARPPEILKEDQNLFLFYFLVKISPYISIFFSKFRNITPNFISIVSIFFLTFSIYLIFIEKYLLSFFFLLLNLLFDLVDGELARLNNQRSKLGETLEKLNSNLNYILFYNSLALSFYLNDFMNISYLLYFFFVSLIYSFTRNKISQIRLSDKTQQNKYEIILMGLYKYSKDIRDKNKTSKIIYAILRNIISSGGVSEITIFILLVFGSINLIIIYFLFLNSITIIYTFTLIFQKFILYKKYKI